MNNKLVAALSASILVLFVGVGCGALKAPICNTQPTIDDCSVGGDNYADVTGATCDEDDDCFEHTTCTDAVLLCGRICDEGELVVPESNPDCGDACYTVERFDRTFRCDVYDDAASEDDA